MSHLSDITDIEKFLSRHTPIKSGDSLSLGEIVDKWRVSAFLGKGGCGEIYRVVHVETGEKAALKIARLSVSSAHARILREADFLEKNTYSFFPRFYSRGESKGLAYFVMELLEPLTLPKSDAGVADLSLKIGEALSKLHKQGFVHRDIKPSNIMVRCSSTKLVEYVLIDLGLVKCYNGLKNVYGGSSVTLVEGRAAGSGTPGYAAPEQFNGGELSPAADIHALGILINECFNGRLPKVWDKIVSRATSSLPDRRYVDVDALILAVQRRHWGKRLICGSFITMLIGILGVFVSSWWCDIGRERWEWYTLGENMTTNVISKELVSITYETNEFGVQLPRELLYRIVTNSVDITLVRLNNRTNKFLNPLRIDPSREYWIVGPGFLEAAFVKPKKKTSVRLENCFFNNRSVDSPENANISYVLTGGVYLNFTKHKNLYKTDHFVNLFDGINNDVRFGGPETFLEYKKTLNNESRARLEEDL